MHESPSEVQSTWGVVEAAREVGVTYKLWPSCRSLAQLFSVCQLQTLCSTSKNLGEAVVMRKSDVVSGSPVRQPSFPESAISKKREEIPVVLR